MLNVDYLTRIKISEFKILRNTEIKSNFIALKYSLLRINTL